MADLVEQGRDNADTAYERSDWRLAPVGWLFLGTLVFLAVAPLVLIWAYPRTLSDADRRLVITPPAPLLQVDPERDLARFRAEEDRKLDTYYWINKQQGVVHIPIADAMKKLSHDGIPGFGKAPP